MSGERSQRAYIFGPSPGTHAERVKLLHSLTATGCELYVGRDLMGLYHDTLKHPYQGDEELFGEQLHALDDERVTRGVVSRSLRELRDETPWLWSVSLRELPQDVLTFGAFLVCLDDSLLGDPRALLLHYGASLCFRVSPPALTLPQQGPLRVVMLEIVERDGLERLSVSILGAAHQLIDGPWWVTLSLAEE